MRRLAVAALLLAILPGCRGRYVFDCKLDSSSCMRDGMPGTCEASPLDGAESYCVFMDASCSEGKWDATADEALAGRCVGAEMLDMSTGGGDLSFSGDAAVNLAGCTTTNDLYAVWGASIDDIWAVGADSTVLHFQGGAACEMQSSGVPPSTILRGVWGRSADDVYIVGDGVILHSTNRGATWVNGTQPSTNQYWAISGANGVVFASVEKVNGVNGGALYKSTDGHTWSNVSGVPADGDPLSGSWSDGVRVWIGGGGNSLWYTDDGATWTPSDPGPFSGYISGIAGVPSTDVIAVASGAVILRNVGGSWSKLFNNGSGGPCGAGFSAVSAAGSQAIAVGVVGCIAASSDGGATWKAYDKYGTSPYTADFNGAWIDGSTGRTMIVGSGGAVYLDPMLPQ